MLEVSRLINGATVAKTNIFFLPLALITIKSSVNVGESKKNKNFISLLRIISNYMAFGLDGWFFTCHFPLVRHHSDLRGKKGCLPHT
jgi:hypothetical protein